MRCVAGFLLLFLSLGRLPLHASQGFYISGQNPQSWEKLLESTGLTRATFDSAKVVVIRPAASSPALDWQSWVRAGGFLILEGSSPLADQFGFRPNPGRIITRRERYTHDPGLLVIWPAPLELFSYRVPDQAVIYSKERWSGSPLIAGFRLGSGGVLWTAVDPGPSGYDRLPYVIHALQELGLDLPFRSKRLWAFFDYSYRTRVDLNYMAQQWRAMGLAGIYVSAWHFFERDAARDEYLRRLISACHQNGILVYAWFEFPHVSEKFWNDHPEWREKTALLQDAAIFWRQNMNLLNRDSFRAAADGVRDLIQLFDWDGVNFAELYFEGGFGINDLPQFTPFNNDVRQEVRSLHGFDPVDLFRPGSPVYYPNNRDALQKFYDYRVELLHRLHVEWIELLLGLRSIRPGLALTLTYIDDLFDKSLHNNLGVDTARTLKLLDSYDFDFLGEDPFAMWHLGPERYVQMAQIYQQLTPHHDRLAVDINIVARPELAFPTRRQTGSEVSRLVHVSTGSFSKVALYFEASIFEADRRLLPIASAPTVQWEEGASAIRVSSQQGVGIRYPSYARVNGQLWPYLDAGTVWLPPGEHTITPSTDKPQIRLLDFNGDLLTATLADSGLAFRYKSNSRAIAVVDRQPQAVRLDGREDPGLRALDYKGRYSLLLPAGEHSVEIVPFALPGNPVLNAGGTVNGASFAAGKALAPGSMVSLFGSNMATSVASARSLPLPLRLAEASVRLNDSAAPLFFASPSQINFQVPWQLVGQQQATLTVTVAGVTSTAMTVNLADLSPGIFSLNQQGTGQGAILLSGSGGQLADAVHPAPRGAAIEIFCTGLGPVTNTPPSGSPASANPLSQTSSTLALSIGGVPATVTFSGLAPGFVGLYQINAEVPQNATPGPVVPVVITVGGISSNTVTMAVD